MLVLDYHQLLNGGGRVADACLEAMGPNGDGFVAVRGMRNYANLRSRLLRLAHKLALMPTAERAAVLKEHELGTDVPLKDPGRSVSSFAAQLRFGELKQSEATWSDDCGGGLSSGGDSLSELGSLFRQLGMCMVEVGLLAARLCDAARSHGSTRNLVISLWNNFLTGDHGVMSNLAREATLEQAILESGTAKGRLIHYHSLLEQETLSSLRKGHKQNKSDSGGGNQRIPITVQTRSPLGGSSGIVTTASSLLSHHHCFLELLLQTAVKKVRW